MGRKKKIEKPKAYIKCMPKIEPYINKYLKNSIYVSKLSKKELDKIRQAEESYANHNRFSFLCNY